MRIFKYEMKFDGKWMDVSTLINSANTEIKNSLCTTEYKSVTNTCSFTLIPSEGQGLFYAQVQEKLLNARNSKTLVDIRISRLSDGEVLFGGYVDNSNLSITSTRRPDSTSISGNDYIAELLDKKINLNLVYENKSVYEIVSSLLREAGYTGTVEASEALNGKTCKYFVTTDDDDVTYRDIIDTLLFEVPGFVLYRNPATGICEIRQIVGTAEPKRTVSYRIADKLVTNTKIFDKDGIKVTYPTVDVQTKRPVYVENISGSSPAEIPAKHYYPENGDVQATYQEYDKNLLDRAYNTKETRLQNSDLDILYVKNPKLNIYPDNKDKPVFDFPILQTLEMPSNPVWYPRKAWILLRNKTDNPVNLELMNIEGDVVYKSKINNITLPAKATEPEEYKTSYIFDESHASEFAKWYYHMKTISSTTSSWVEVNLESSLGEKVIVSHKDSAVSQAHVVVQINNVSLGGGIRGYKITAVALSDFSSYEYAKDVRLNSTTKKGIYKEYSEYYNSTSETELVGGAWSQTLYIDPNKTLWIRRVVQYTDGTSYISAPAPSGKDGKPGKDGENSYVHIAYANSADGTLDFSTSISAGKKYLGQCVDKNADSPTDPTVYKWTKIEGAKGEKGDPAPYAVQIYTASETKPATPTGTADQVPSGWNTKIPQRTEKQVIWTSIAVVDVKNGQYSYGTWSEPSKYTPDQSDIALIVEWKWGASDVVNPDEENTTIALEDDTILSVNGQAVVLGTNDTSWSKTIPEQPADKPYLWKREWQYAYIGDYGVEHQAGWVYYCVTGKLGVEGSYQGLGYNIAGSSIIFAGLDTEGNPTLASFRVSINGEAVAFQRKSFNIIQDQGGSFHERYFLVAYWTIGVGNLALCYLTPASETDSTGAVSYRMKWVAQDGTEIITTSIDGVSYDPYVLADIKVSGASIKSVTLLNPTKLKAYETDYFMSIIAQNDIGNITSVAKALDVERVFEKVAALEAFVNKLFANYIKIYQAIYGGGYDKNGNNPTDADGFYLNKDGIARIVGLNAKDANLSGSFSCPVFRTISGKDVASINIPSVTMNVFYIQDMASAVVNNAIGRDTDTILPCTIEIGSKTYTQIRSCPEYREIGYYVVIEETSTRLKLDFRRTADYSDCVFGDLNENGFAPISKVGTCIVNGTTISKGTYYCMLSMDSQSAKLPRERTAFTGTISANKYNDINFKIETYSINSTSQDRYYIYMRNDYLYVEKNSGETVMVGKYFTSLSISINVDTTPGIEVQNILPMEGSFNIGLRPRPFNNGYFNTVYGTHDGYVNGNDTTRTNMSAKVWGAVAN